MSLRRQHWMGKAGFARSTDCSAAVPGEKRMYVSGTDAGKRLDAVPIAKGSQCKKGKC